MHSPHGVAPPPAGDPGRPVRRRRDGPAASRRAGGDPRPVLHRHRADHLRDRREAQGGHARVHRLQRRGRERSRSWSSSSSRARSRRAPASAACAATWPSTSPGWAGPSGRSPTCRPRCRAMPSSPSSPAPRSSWGQSRASARSPPRVSRSSPAYREEVRQLAISKARDPDLLLGMLDRDADLRLVRTADKAVHYVMAENLDAFQKSHQVIEERPAWDGGLRGVLTAQRRATRASARGPPTTRTMCGASITSPAGRPSRTRCSASCPARCGSTWKVRWIR